MYLAGYQKWFSGKPSLLSTLLDIESGTIVIDGIDLSRIPPDVLRERIIAIPQDAFILTGTVRLNADPLVNNQRRWRNRRRLDQSQTMVCYREFAGVWTATWPSNPSLSQG
jgi:ABC-type multidrug transport system fused ATPase/permease subunit